MPVVLMDMLVVAMVVVLVVGDVIVLVDDIRDIIVLYLLMMLGI